MRAANEEILGTEIEECEVYTEGFTDGYVKCIRDLKGDLTKAIDKLFSEIGKNKYEEQSNDCRII